MQFYHIKYTFVFIRVYVFMENWSKSFDLIHTKRIWKIFSCYEHSPIHPLLISSSSWRPCPWLSPGSPAHHASPPSHWRTWWCQWSPCSLDWATIGKGVLLYLLVTCQWWCLCRSPQGWGQWTAQTGGRQLVLLPRLSPRPCTREGSWTLSWNPRETWRENILQF